MASNYAFEKEVDKVYQKSGLFGKVAFLTGIGAMVGIGVYIGSAIRRGLKHR